AARRRLSRARAPRRGVRRVRALRVGAHREPGDRGRGRVRAPLLLLDRHLERGGRRRDGAPGARPAVALRPLLSLRARRDRHAERRVPAGLHRGVPRVHVLRARHAALAGDSLIASRNARGWAELGVQVARVVVALGALQLTAERTNRRVDLTPGRTMSLSPVTRRVLGEVAAPLRMTIFYRRGTRERYADLAARLPVENRLVSVDLVDLDRHPERAEALGVTTYGRAALEYEGRRAVVPALSEEAL